MEHREETTFDLLPSNAEKIWNISYTCRGQEFNQKFCPEPPSDHISHFTGFPKMKLGFILKTVDLCTIFINYLENSNVVGCRTNIYLQAIKWNTFKQYVSALYLFYILLQYTYFPRLHLVKIKCLSDVCARGVQKVSWKFPIKYIKYQNLNSLQKLFVQIFITQKQKIMIKFPDPYWH